VDRNVPRIVVIEEDQLMRGLLVEWLSAEGYSVCAGARCDDAPDEADLVIVDVYMPRHDCTSRLRVIKNAHPRTPVIAISGHFTPGLSGPGAAADAVGAEQVIAKPFSRRDLLAAVHSLIGPPV
jgi:DNA-binding response OmpR family regulator